MVVFFHWQVTLNGRASEGWESPAASFDLLCLKTVRTMYLSASLWREIRLQSNATDVGIFMSGRW